MVECKEKLLRAKVQLARKEPFFAYLVSLLQFVWDESIQTISINPFGVVRVNPKYFERLSDREAQAVLCHEVLHCALEHFLRRKGRDKMLWNVAVDVAVNELLDSSGFSLPKEALRYHQLESWKKQLDALKADLKRRGVQFRELSK